MQGAQQEGYLIGASATLEKYLASKEDKIEVKILNLTYRACIATNQQVLGFLLPTLSQEALQQVVACTTAASTWKIIDETFISMTRARFINTRMSLSSMQKGSMTITKYMIKM